MTRRKRICIIVFPITVAIVLYVSLYAHLRTEGVRRAIRQSSPGFYFVDIREDKDFKLHQHLLFVFYPIYLIDQLTFNGIAAGAEPLVHIH